MEIVQYDKKYKFKWDEFVDASKNGVFLFKRDYMDYHEDRFKDFSLMFYEKEKIIATMPADIKGDYLISHGGLTFGGIVTDARMRAVKMLEIFNALKGFLQDHGINSFIYKAIPHIYADMPAEEDLYALQYVGAKLCRRDVSSTIDLRNKLSFSKGRKWLISRAKKMELYVKKVNDFKEFMTILEENLMRQHGVKPVHTLAEMELLAGRFPENIKLFAALRDNVMVGGVVIYESRHVAHTQYIAATEEGKEMGATDIIMNHLINEYYEKKRYFDFGISTEDEGRYLNEGLIENKGSYGARAVVYDFYEWDLYENAMKRS